MNAKFTSVHIVPKLNATNDPSITSVVNMIEDIANRLDVEVVGKTRVTQDTLAIAIGGDGTMLEAMQSTKLSVHQCGKWESLEQ